MKRILDHGPAIRKGLGDFLALQRSDAPADAPWQRDVLERLLPFATAGKLLRGGLVCFGYEAFSGRTITKPVVRAAMAVELMHSGLLIHDDIMDNDALRRGSPSMHEQYRQLAMKRSLTDAETLGVNLAMNAGDTALFLASGLLGTIDVPPDIGREVQQLFSGQLITTTAGQMQDLALEASSGQPSKQELYDLMVAKTASYTVSLPLMIGACLAEAPTPVIEQLKIFGTKTGMVFQLRDDELGVMGETARTGKPVGSDITEGKWTLLRYHLFEACSAEERNRLKDIFGNRNAKPADIGYVRELVERRGVRTQLDSEISALEEQALRAITPLRLSSEAADELRWLVDFCGRRTA